MDTAPGSCRALDTKSWTTWHYTYLWFVLVGRRRASKSPVPEAQFALHTTQDKKQLACSVNRLTVKLIVQSGSELLVAGTIESTAGLPDSADTA